MTEQSPSRRPRRLRGRLRGRHAAVGVAAGTAVALGLFAAQSVAGESPYRTAAAVVADVKQTATYDGTIAASNRSDLSFATGGTVAAVSAEVGDTVVAGQTLARLDSTDLRAAVTSAESDLAAAKAYLEDVEDGQIDTVRQAAAGGAISAASASSVQTGSTVSAVYVVSAGTTTAAAATTSADLEDALAKIADQQDAVTSAQSAATEAIAAAKAALTAQQEACAETDTDTDAETDGDSASDGDTDGTTGTSPTASAAIPAACADALTAVQAAQETVATRQDELQSALTALSGTLDAAVKALQDAAESGGSSSGGQTPSTPNSQTPKTQTPKTQTPQSQAPDSATPQSGGGASSGTTATAADLAEAQASVDTAQAALEVAQANLAAATMTAPFDGTIMAASLTKGADVASGDVAFVLIGDGGNTATLSVPVADLAAISVGQAATVTSGESDPAAGTVTSIGLLPQESDGTQAASSATTYQVVVSIDGDLSAPEGAPVSVAIVTGSATDAVTVPASAVTRATATRGFVQVVEDGEVTRTPVTLGVTGETTIAVTEGLKAGQEVVVADLEAALPTSDSGSTGRGFGAGGFGNGGPGGGPPAGAGGGSSGGPLSR